MTRLRCKKCGNVFEQGLSAGIVFAPHIGPYKIFKCPACRKLGWFNVYSSVKDPVTWPPEEKSQEHTFETLSEEELERKQIEESKYEKP